MNKSHVLTKSSNHVFVNIFFCLFIGLVSCLSFTSFAQQSKPLRIAVSANFFPVLNEITPLFEQETQQKVELISGATGILYQQIVHGAPFDIFLSADAERPQRLISQDIAFKDSLHTYAVGQLALFSSNTDIASLNVLSNITEKFTMPNPYTAPYGKAAKQVLTNLTLWDSLEKKRITANNVNQSFQQVISGAVSLGFVANSQLKINQRAGFLLPQNLYDPIKQQAVILKRTQQLKLATTFINYLTSANIQKQLIRYGYLSDNELISTLNAYENQQ